MKEIESIIQIVVPAVLFVFMGYFLVKYVNKFKEKHKLQKQDWAIFLIYVVAVSVTLITFIEITKEYILVILVLLFFVAQLIPSLGKSKTPLWYLTTSVFPASVFSMFYGFFLIIG